MKKYNQPTTEVLILQTAQLMQGLTLSPGDPNNGSGRTDAPRRGDLIP